MTGLLVLALSLLACGAPPPGEGPPPPRHLRGVAEDLEPPGVQVRPSVERIPANALEFELTWSRTMRLVPHRTRVLDPQGDEIKGAIPRLEWDVHLRVATARLAPLDPGGPYTLRIDGFEAADGALARVEDHPFYVVPADERPVDGTRIEVRGRPLPHTRQPVTVTFPEPMHHSVVHAVTCLAGGSPWEGAWVLDRSQRVVTYEPAISWPESPVRVSVGAGAVDLARNPIADRPGGLLTPMVEVDIPLAGTPPG